MTWGVLTFGNTAHMPGIGEFGHGPGRGGGTCLPSVVVDPLSPTISDEST